MQLAHIQLTFTSIVSLCTVSRINVDALNTNAHNNELKGTFTSYDDELKSKDALIEKYETEIRQRHDKIEKKQVYIARLNKNLDEVRERRGEVESTGPLEATIKSM
jgi:peptidoglycan hydrolase CwlO-like protein